MIKLNRGDSPQTPARKSPPSPRRPSGTHSGTPKLRRKKTVEDTLEAGTSSRRLVEYFVVVSSLPRWGGDQNPASPHTPTSMRKKHTPPKNQGQSVERERDAPMTGNPATPGDGNIHMPLAEGSDYTFQPKITARYPPTDYPDHALNPMVTQFCYPHSDIIVPSNVYVMPRVHHFVLTNDKGRKVYGTSLTVFEEYLSTVDDPFRLRGTIHSSEGDLDIEVTAEDDDEIETLYIPRVLCILSTWPYLTAFREYLTQLYRLATSTNLMKAPIERFIQNLCLEIPAPPPGAFEIHVPILSSTIRFWAPPANLPLAYVALPYQTLFECLELSNVLTVWYALILERKVLLLSSQHSILTVCAEILSSLLFPMQWSHLYIPLVPRFLSPMLDAPFPYLCGVVRENWLHAQQHISDETMVVDLDSNTVMSGGRFPELPPAPPKKWGKLASALESDAGDLFWKARGIEPEYALFRNGKINKRTLDKTKEKQGDPRWKERLASFDEAFNLAYAPDSPNLLNDAEGGDEQSQWDKVQEAFLRFFVSLLKDYRKFLQVLSTDVPETPEEDPSQKWSKRRTFDIDGFIGWQRTDSYSFVNEFCLTQLFDDFVTKRMYSPGEPDVIFFDQSIDAKLNRSRLKVRKVNTPFLQSAKVHKQLSTVKAVAPSEEDIVAPENAEGSFTYRIWPQEFDASLFCAPRPIPAIITAEFDRQSALISRLRATSVDSEDAKVPAEFYGGDYNPSPEVATFTVFFFVYSAVIGLEWQEYRQKQQTLHEAVGPAFEPSPMDEKQVGLIQAAPSDEDSQDYPVETRERNEVAEVATCPNDYTENGILSDLTLGMHESVLSLADCATDPCDLCPKVPADANRLQTEIAVQLESWEANPGPENEKLARQASSLESTDGLAEYEEAKEVASAQLNLAFSALTTMALRGLSPDPDAFQSLMEACGRCGDTDRAFKLLDLMKREGLVTDSEVYASLMRAFANGDDLGNGKGPITASPQPRHYRRGSDAYTTFLRSQLELSKQAEDGRTERTESSDEGSVFSSETDGSIPPPTSSVVADFYNAVAQSIEGFTTPHKPTRKKKRRSRRRSSTGSNSLFCSIVTDGVRKQIDLGSSLLDFLYPHLVIDTSSDACPQCSRALSEDEIIEGWQPCEFKDYTTQCPQCSHRFVPRFSVISSSPTFEGSQGIATPLYCEFLSPWVVRQELEHVIRGTVGIEGMQKPSWRTATDINATLWWNMIAMFRHYRLPVSFLLQGSFHNRLINPTPDN